MLAADPAITAPISDMTSPIACWLPPPYPWLCEIARRPPLNSTPATQTANVPHAAHRRIVSSLSEPGGALPCPGLGTAAMQVQHDMGHLGLLVRVEEMQQLAQRA